MSEKESLQFRMELCIRKETRQKENCPTRLQWETGGLTKFLRKRIPYDRSIEEAESSF
jgi:hypothetical protein